jgi:hypothetical protein
VTLLSARSMAEPPGEAGYPETRVTEGEWRAFQEKVRAIPDIQCREDDRNFQLICDSASLYTIWVFTTRGHRAHPAVSRGRMVVTDQYVGIDRHGYYAGSEEAFRLWHREFRVLDQRQVKEWESLMRNGSRPPSRGT